MVKRVIQSEPHAKQDLLMKDPCQHLNFENLKKSGKISFWIKHTGQMEQEPCSLIVANLTYRAATGGDSEQTSHSSSKRTELRLPLVKPVQVGSKCATGMQWIVTCSPTNPVYFHSSLID